LKEERKNPQNEPKKEVEKEMSLKEGNSLKEVILKQGEMKGLKKKKEEEEEEQEQEEEEEQEEVRQRKERTN
jgi:hypothetical protein